MCVKYEIEHVCYAFKNGEIHINFFESEIAMLTGLSLVEILPITSKIKRWSGSAYVDVFRKLGYNCNAKFKKFDKNTEYPCLMRCNEIKRTSSFWYGFVYYDGFVYCVYEGKIKLDDFLNFNSNLKITSMLQVWI